MATPDTVTDTIAAISTPPGRGGIGIVRLSGPQAASIASQLVRLRHPAFEHAHARLADVLDAGRQTTPRASTKPSSLFLPRRIPTLPKISLRLRRTARRWCWSCCCAAPLELGARLAEPGEFTQRAFLSGPPRPHAGRSGSRPDRSADAHAGAAGRQPDGRRAQPPRCARQSNPLWNSSPCSKPASTLPKTIWT